MKIFALLIVGASLLGSASQSAGQNDKPSGVSGVVADVAESAPISYAVVFIHSGQGQLVSLRVDSQGKFAAPLQPGYYDIFFAAEGFAPSCQRFKLGLKEQKQINPKLGPSLDTLEERRTH